MTDGETGFQDLRARLYDPTTGQFLSRDTYGGQSGNALSLNRYSYGNNDPTRLVDPSGHDAIQSLLSNLDCLKRIITGIPSAIQNNWDAIKTIGSYVLPLLPLIGSAYLLVSALVGHDPLTGRTLSSDEIHQDLLFGVVGVIFDSGAGSALKDAFSAGRAVDDLSTLTRALDEAGSGARDVTAAERTVSEGVADGAQDEARAINRAASEGADQSIPICRGTSRPAELAATRETGYAMSDAARTAYIEGRGAGESLDEAVQSGRSASEAADARQLTFWGSRNDYVQAHGAFGTEFQREIGIPRSMISFTTDPEIAVRFAGRNGAVFSARVPVSAVFPQTLPVLPKQRYSSCT